MVRDGTGASIPGATIVVREASAGLNHVVDGNRDGSFAVAALRAGRYLVTVAAQGFAPVTQTVAVPLTAPLIVTHLGQLYYRFISPSNFYQVIGNPTLEPENAHSWQFGGDYVATGRRARAGVNVLRNAVRDLIESQTVGIAVAPAQLTDLLAREGLDPAFRPVLGRPILTYRNLFDVVTSGVELDGEAALTDAISVGGSYTYLSAVDDETGLDLTGRHRHHGHARVSWQPRGWGLRASVRGTFFSS